MPLPETTVGDSKSTFVLKKKNLFQHTNNQEMNGENDKNV